MTQKAGKVIGSILVSDLERALGSSLEVCRSANERSKYPIYIRTKFGPVNFNNAAGQEALKTHAKFDEVEVIAPEKTPEVAEVTPEPEPEPEPEPGPAPKKKPRFSINKLLFGDDE